MKITITTSLFTVFFLYWYFALATFAEAQIDRSVLTGEFQGTPIAFTYKSDSGEVVTEEYKIRLGRLDRTVKCTQITSSNSTFQELLLQPVGLIAEHWWLSFEMNMLCQREYDRLSGAAKELELQLGRTPIIENPIYRSTYLNISQYWVPFFIWNQIFPWNFSPEEAVAGRQEYFNQFIAGLIGIQRTLDQIQAMETHLDQLRKLK